MCKSTRLIRVLADLTVSSCFAHNRHPHYTVRVAARDGEEFAATLHVRRDGKVLDSQGKVTEEPFPNGGKERAFDKGDFVEI